MQHNEPPVLPKPQCLTVDRSTNTFFVCGKDGKVERIPVKSQADLFARDVKHEPVEILKKFRIFHMTCSKDGKLILALHETKDGDRFKPVSEIIACAISSGNANKLLGRIGVFNGRAEPTFLSLTSASRCFVVLPTSGQIVHFDLPSTMISLEQAELQSRTLQVISKYLMTKTVATVSIPLGIGFVIFAMSLVFPAVLSWLRRSRYSRFDGAPELFSKFLDFLEGKFCSNSRILGYWIDEEKAKFRSFLKKCAPSSGSANGMTDKYKALMSHPTGWLVINGSHEDRIREASYKLATWCLEARKPSLVPIFVRARFPKIEKIGLNESIIDACQIFISGLLAEGRSVDRELVAQLLKQSRILLIMDFIEPMDSREAEVLESLRNPPSDFPASHIVILRKGELRIDYATQVDENFEAK